MIDNEKRIEAAAAALQTRYSENIGAGRDGYLPNPGTPGASWIDYARHALAAADAITAETHWLAPNEATMTMIVAGHEKCRRGPEYSMTAAEECFLAMRAAYLPRSPMTSQEKRNE